MLDYSVSFLTLNKEHEITLCNFLENKLFSYLNTGEQTEVYLLLSPTFTHEIKHKKNIKLFLRFTSKIYQLIRSSNVASQGMLHF